MFETSTLAMYFAPIAVTICFGLSLATLLVLVVIPALILLLEQTKSRVVRRISNLTGKDHVAQQSETAGSINA